MMTLRLVGLVTTKLVTGIVPTMTPVQAVIFVPLMPTCSPPVEGPLVCDNPVTDGAEDW